MECLIDYQMKFLLYKTALYDTYTYIKSNSDSQIVQ